MDRLRQYKLKGSFKLCTLCAGQYGVIQHGLFHNADLGLAVGMERAWRCLGESCPIVECSKGKKKLDLLPVIRPMSQQL